MDATVMTSVQAKCSVFDLYFEVPENVRPEVNELVGKIYAIGEQSASAMDFEQKFQQDLMSEYTAIFAKLVPKTFPETTPEQVQAEANQGANNELKHQASIFMHEGARIAERDAMMAAGVIRPYMQIKGAVNTAKMAGSLAGKLFGKKESRKNDPEKKNT